MSSEPPRFPEPALEPDSGRLPTEPQDVVWAPRPVRPKFQHNYRTHLILFLLTFITTTAAGAYVGAKEGNGKAKNAAVGAAAGFVVGEAINYLSNKAQREAYLAGYEKGQSNAVKQQYWVARENQRAATDDGFEEALYEVSIPQTDRDGVRREPTTRVIRVVLPKEES